MHVIIITDLEGVSCVDSIDMMDTTKEGYRKACEYLMADVNAAIAGALEGGADRITVVDGHGSGRNFLPGMLDPRAEQISARDFCCNPLTGVDAILCVGCHAMAGTEKAFLDHTQISTRWFDYRINGVSMGEIGQQAVIGGVYQAPVVMVSGDEAACLEAQALIPGVLTASVKTAQIRNQAECVPQAEALVRIRKAAAEGVMRYRQIPTISITLPAEVSLTLYRTDYCDEIMHEGLTRKGRTLTKTLKKVTCYWDITRLEKWQEE